MICMNCCVCISVGYHRNCFTRTHCLKCWPVPRVVSWDCMQMKHSTAGGFNCETSKGKALFLSLLLVVTAFIHQKCICKTTWRSFLSFSEMGSVSNTAGRDCTRKCSHSKLLYEELQLNSKVVFSSCSAVVQRLTRTVCSWICSFCYSWLTS